MTNPISKIHRSSVKERTLFEPQGSLPDLLQYLAAEFATVATADQLKAAEHFIGWATQQLTSNRPVEVFAVDNNYGIQLTNGSRVQLCPNVPGTTTGTGAMAGPDNSISI
jgi:hypothetical protein